MGKDKNNNKRQPGQEGVSLIITFFIMIIILAVVLSVSALLYSQIKVIRNIGNSIASFYAADSGIEKVLYYDRQVLPVLEKDDEGNDIFGKRGLCSMFNQTTNPNNYCRMETGNSIAPSIYCNPPDAPATFTEGSCDPSNCIDCTINFKTEFDNRVYSVQAQVNSSYYLDVRSSGTFGGAGRRIETLSPL